MNLLYVFNATASRANENIKKTRLDFDALIYKDEIYIIYSKCNEFIYMRKQGKPFTTYVMKWILYLELPMLWTNILIYYQ